MSHILLNKSKPANRMESPLILGSLSVALMLALYQLGLESNIRILSLALLPQVLSSGLLKILKILTNRSIFRARKVETFARMPLTPPITDLRLFCTLPMRQPLPLSHNLLVEISFLTMNSYSFGSIQT
jgi:hypothetical protein